MAVSEDKEEGTLGTRIRARRKVLGLSASALAKAVGAHPSMMSRWENDRARPRAKSVQRLSAALGVTSDWLLTGEQPLPKKGVLIHPSGVFTKWLADFGRDRLNDDQIRWLAKMRRPDGRLPQHPATYRIAALAILAPDA